MRYRPRAFTFRRYFSRPGSAPAGEMASIVGCFVCHGGYYYEVRSGWCRMEEGWWMSAVRLHRVHTLPLDAGIIASLDALGTGGYKSGKKAMEANARRIHTMRSGSVE